MRYWEHFAQVLAHLFTVCGELNTRKRRFEMFSTALFSVLQWVHYSMDSRRAEMMQYFQTFRDQSNRLILEKDWTVRHQYIGFSKCSSLANNHRCGVFGRSCLACEEPLVVGMVVSKYEDTLLTVGAPCNLDIVESWQIIRLPPMKLSLKERVSFPLLNAERIWIQLVKKF